MARADKMAENIIAALAAETDEERTQWRGEEPGACPVCHQSMFRVYPGSTKVECAICGIFGELFVDGGKVDYRFSEAEQLRSRMRYGGKLEHRNEIAHGAMTQQKVENLSELKKKYLHVGE